MGRDTDKGGVLRRMIKPAGGTAGPDTEAVRPVWDRALSRAGRVYGGLDPVLSSMKLAAGQARDDVLQGIDGRGLLAILDPTAGAKADGRGIIWASGNVIDALIEVQTLGRVSDEAGPDRKITRIDVALCRDFLDLLLSGAAREGAGAGIPVPALRFGTEAADLRAAALPLTGPGYDRFDLAVDLGGGRRDGRITLILPQSAPAGAVAPLSSRHDLISVMQEAQVELPAILASITLPLDRLDRLTVGTTLPLGGVTLDDVWLEDGSGRRVIRGRLGRLGSDRALRVDPGPAAAGRAHGQSAAAAALSRPDAADADADAPPALSA